MDYDQWLMGMGNIAPLRMVGDITRGCGGDLLHIFPSIPVVA